MAGRYERVGEVRADESGSTCDNDLHAVPGPFEAEGRLLTGWTFPRA